MEKAEKYLHADDVKNSLINVPQITFEVTDACNLKCTYCGYGEFYADYDARENKMLPVEKAIILLNYLNNLWSSEPSTSLKKEVYISFYGGEPLMNMQFIKQIIDFIANELGQSARHFIFSMTTNAILLHKYIDYLVENDFNLLISLDGNQENTAYRIDKNGKPAFDRIIKNINLVRDKYPDYFLKKINFNAVLHNNNSVEDIYLFFKNNYDKIPSIGELNNIGIRPEKQAVFNETYRNSTENLYQSEHYEEIEKNMFLNTSTYQSAALYLLRYNAFVYEDYNELLYGKSNSDFSIPTGTCIPFSKKIYVTVNGKILPCERIGHQFALGEITETEVHLDLQAIADTYNQYYEKLDTRCKSCYNQKACVQCIYNLPDLEKNPVCHGYMSKKEFERYEHAQLNFLARNPESYTRIMTEILRQ